jgi:hypothetical protein
MFVVEVAVDADPDPDDPADVLPEPAAARWAPMAGPFSAEAADDEPPLELHPATSPAPATASATSTVAPTTRLALPCDLTVLISPSHAPTRCPRARSALLGCGCSWPGSPDPPGNSCEIRIG